jgi:uncharacterized protein
MLKQQVKPYKEFVQDYYLDKDPAHNFRHIERIVSRLDFLSKEILPTPNKSLLYFLACFHGLEKNIRDDKSFYKQVRHFLLDLEWTETEIKRAFESLKRHTTKPQTVEEAIVHDANYVELLGAFGIAKAFTTGGARKQTYEETADIFEYQYLDKVVFLTPRGKRIAQEKKAYTKKFFKQLRSEL